MSLPERGEQEPAALDRFAITREELLDSYAAPYRRWLPLALKRYGVHRYVAADVVLGACWILGAVTSYERLVLEAAAIDRGRAELVEREAALDLAVETRSTAAALRRITGQ